MIHQMTTDSKSSEVKCHKPHQPSFSITRYGGSGAKEVLKPIDWTDRDAAYWYELCITMNKDLTLASCYDIQHMEWQSLRLTTPLPYGHIILLSKWKKGKSRRK